jgi:inner membrane protein
MLRGIIRIGFKPRFLESHLDSVSQVVLGAAACHAVTGKTLGRKSLYLGAVLGTLPDLDVFIQYGNAVSNFTYHRGFSHSLLVLTAVSPIIWFLLRRFNAFKTIGSGRLLLGIWLALITHPLLDGFTVYGTQLFWPLPRVPESWASVFIIDPLYTVPLLITGLWALFKRPKLAILSIAGLCISSAYLAWSMSAKYMVVQHMRQELARQNIPYQQMKVTPERYNTLFWRGIVMDKENYYETRASVFQRSGPLRFNAYRHNKNWLDKLPNNWAAHRLAWFTGGFYRMSDRENMIVVSDLRMGSEGFSIFEFAVADRNDLQKPFWPRNAPR